MQIPTWHQKVFEHTWRHFVFRCVAKKNSMIRYMERYKATLNELHDNFTFLHLSAWTKNQYQKQRNDSMYGNATKVFFLLRRRCLRGANPGNGRHFTMFGDFFKLPIQDCAGFFRGHPQIHCGRRHSTSCIFITFFPTPLL